MFQQYKIRIILLGSLIIISTLVFSYLAIFKPEFKTSRAVAITNHKDLINIESGYPKLKFSDDAVVILPDKSKRFSTKKEYQTKAEDFSEGQNRLEVRYFRKNDYYSVTSKNYTEYKIFVDTISPELSSAELEMHVLYTDRGYKTSINFSSEVGAELFYNNKSLGIFNEKDQSFNLVIDKDTEEHDFWSIDKSGNKSEKIKFRGSIEKLLEYKNLDLSYAFNYPSSWSWQNKTDLESKTSVSNTITLRKDGFSLTVESILINSPSPHVESHMLCTQNPKDYVTVKNGEIFRIPNFSTVYEGQTYWYEKQEDSWTYKFGILKNPDVAENESKSFDHVYKSSSSSSGGFDAPDAVRNTLPLIYSLDLDNARDLYNTCFAYGVSDSFVFDPKIRPKLTTYPTNNYSNFLSVKVTTNPSAENFETLMLEVDAIAKSFQFEKR